ncbi:MAG: hypothetical protein ACOZBH_04525 [Patescibacteria group bacterium]
MAPEKEKWDAHEKARLAALGIEAKTDAEPVSDSESKPARKRRVKK